MQDLTQLTPEQLEDYRVALLAELDRRNRPRDIPNDIKKMATDFETLGGSKDDLIAKINEPDAPEDAEVA